MGLELSDRLLVNEGAAAADATLALSGRDSAMEELRVAAVVLFEYADTADAAVDDDRMWLLLPNAGELAMAEAKLTSDLNKLA